MTDLVFQSFADELEKIASVKSAILAAAGGGVLGAATGLGGAALYLHGNAMQDRMLKDMGFLPPEEARSRQIKRIAAITGAAAAMGLGGAAIAGLGTPLAQKYVSSAIKESTKGMWETAGDAMQRGLDQGLERQVKSGDKLLSKQMEYGRQMIIQTAPEVSRSMGREFVGGMAENIPLFGRFFRKKAPKAGGKAITFRGKPSSPLMRR